MRIGTKFPHHTSHEEYSKELNLCLTSTTRRVPSSQELELISLFVHFNPFVHDDKLGTLLLLLTLGICFGSFLSAIHLGANNKINGTFRIARVLP